MSVREAVYEALAFITGLEPKELEESENIDLFDNGVLDSLSFVQCIAEISESTGKKISIKELDTSRCRTIATLIEEISAE